MNLSLDSLGGYVQQAFVRAAAKSSTALHDDELIRAAARNIYDYIPFPANVAIKMSVGIEGLERFALSFRDTLLAAGVTDLSRIGADDFRQLMLHSLSVVPGLGTLLGTGEKSPPALRALQPKSLPAPAPVKPQAQPRAWYLLRGQTRFGPWTDAEFLFVLDSGTLTGADRVWIQGFPEWIELRQFPAFVTGKVARSA